MEKSKLSIVLVTDCGSTTTKALLFGKAESGWKTLARGEAPTTVEEPVADVTVGAINAFEEIQELVGRKILNGDLKEGSPFMPAKGDSGIDLYLSTSSAGGGLQMMVAGVVKNITTESAERAALGAGAIVLDAISADDGLEEHERIERIRHLRPDIMLITGGVDGGATSHVVEIAEILLAASPKPRFGTTLKLPVIYAGNKEAAKEVKEILDRFSEVTVVPNVRPSLEEENLHPAREAIHDFFLSHVMSHSPGYGKLLSWSPVPIMPTPAAVGDMVTIFAEEKNLQVLCVDIGGATTDVFSVFHDREGKKVFNRTVSANYGMSYSIANVLVEAGVENISRWLPLSISNGEVRDRLRNKMIRPTSIPETLEDLYLEQAVCREALRLSLGHHRSLAVGLSGAQRKRGIADIFSQESNRYELVDLMNLDAVIGSGGVLSHAPSRTSAALMMIDGFALEGFTHLLVDSVFMMPHLGVLASVHKEAATEIFEKDCIVNVAHVVAPVFNRKIKSPVIGVVFLNGEKSASIDRGVVSRIELKEGEKYDLRVLPSGPEIDVGAGKGAVLERTLIAGESGLFLDGRNRPIEFPAEKRAEYNAKMYQRLGLSI